MGNFTIWLTGMPCSGKTTIAKALEKKVNAEKLGSARFICLDGDDLRTKLNSDLGFSEDDRRENLRRVGHVAQLFNEKGLNVICSFVSPTDSLRKAALNSLETSYLVSVDCSAEKCAERDVKGMWAKAKAGEIKMFTGFDAPFDSPAFADLVVNTEVLTINECVDAIIDKFIR